MISQRYVGLKKIKKKGEIRGTFEIFRGSLPFEEAVASRRQ
jgi:hypothetical protein